MEKNWTARREIRSDLSKQGKATRFGEVRACQRVVITLFTRETPMMCDICSTISSDLSPICHLNQVTHVMIF